MTRLVEISAEAVGGVRADVADVRGAVDARWDGLRARAWRLGVPTSGFDEVLAVGDRIGTSVLPVIDTHLERARSLAGLRYGGRMGVCLPVVDSVTPPAPAPFTQTPLGDGSTTLAWEPAPDVEVAADREEAEQSQGITGWLGDRWDDVSGAVSDAGDWIGDRAADAWDTVTEAGAAIGEWWERTSADLGEWIDEHAQGVRDFIAQHVGVIRFLADASRVIGWVVVGLGAILTVGLGIIGAMGGGALGAVFGLGAGAVPGGVAGALAGVKIGLTVLGAGFALVSVGDFLDVAADWGEGKIDGQELVQLGALELGLAATSFLGLGALGKILQKTAKHLPASWRSKLDDWLGRHVPRTGPLDDAGMRAPLRSGAPTGDGWRRMPDTNPIPDYGQPMGSHGTTFQPWNDLPSNANPKIEDLGGNLRDPWGVNPATGRPFTEAEWKERFLEPNGEPRWPGNDGAVPGTRISFGDADDFLQTYGDKFDRIGGTGGDYLGVPPGTPFDQRSLPPGHLGRDLHEYEFTGNLPPGVTIEVSEIAPAFGRPGGGIQVRFMNGDKPIPIADLLIGSGSPAEGVLR